MNNYWNAKSELRKHIDIDTLELLFEGYMEGVEVLSEWRLSIHLEEMVKELGMYEIVKKVFMEDGKNFQVWFDAMKGKYMRSTLS